MSSKENSDVLVIGGGVIGMSIARELKKKGAGKVTLLERGHLGQEASFAAAGMLTPQADAEKHGDFFDLCYEGRGLYEEFAGELKAETGIDIELETSGTLSVAFNEKDSRRLESIYRWQSAASLPVERLDGRQLLELEPFLSPEVRGAFLFPRDAQVENRLLVKALALSLEKAGVKVAENITVTTLAAETGENGKITGAETSAGKFSAPVVVLATGAWSSLINISTAIDTAIHTGERNRPLPLDVIPVRGQMLSFHPGEKLFTRVIISPSGYLVPRADRRVLAGATVEKAGFDKNVTTEGLQYLLNSAHEIAPGLEKFEIVEKWAGLRPYAADGLPIIGPYNNFGGLYVATAHYRNGILLAPITARMLADHIISAGVSRYMDAFGTDRFASSASA
jgi:glycine oxidase